MKLCARVGLGVNYVNMNYSFVQHSWRKCRPVEISISLDSLVLVSTLYILLLTMLKSLANTMKTNSKPFDQFDFFRVICFSEP